ncbi:MAG: 30S ribosomal protein S1 [Alphaproteobacteria bacterium]
MSEENIFAGESFEALLNESVPEEGFEGGVVKGTIVKIDDDYVIIDVGLKSEGRIAKKEFVSAGQQFTLGVGEQVDVYVDRYEDRDGAISLSREKARREEAWVELEKKFEAGERVNGTIFRRVKGGFTVDLQGAIAFLPGSQVDVRLVRDVAPLMGQEQPFQIVKMERNRSNIVVSRRAVLEEDRAEARSELVAGLKEGANVEGIVKNITDYGAFVDLGGVDGLLHVTDISWRRINHPSEALHIGQTLKVQIIRFNEETQRISLGLKQLESDPWENVADKYKVGEKFTGKVTNITDYGAFVELDDGIEGLVHVSEMSWTRKNVHPGKIVSTSQEVEVVVLEVDQEKRRISLGIKQATQNPWEAFAASHPVGAEVEGEIKNITEFGLFVGLNDEIDGMVHLSDLSWDISGEDAIKEYKKGDVVKAKVLEADPEKERVSLGIKQLSDDPFESGLDGVKRGEAVKATVTEVQEDGLVVSVGDGAKGYIRKAELAKTRAEQDTSNYKVGDEIEARVTKIDRGSRNIELSVKALELAEEKALMKELSSSDDSGAALGDALKEALARKDD